MLRSASAVLLLLVPTLAALADGLPRSPAGRPANSFADIAEMSADVVPAKARPGEVVTIRLKVKPNPGAWTYPVNVPKGQLSKNTIAAPQSDDVLFPKPLTVRDPDGAEEKPNATNTGFDAVYKYPAEPTWEIEGIVSPTATPGKKTIELKGTRLQACDETACFPLSRPPKVEFEVTGGPAVPVSPRFASLIGQHTVTVANADPAPMAESTGPAEVSAKKAPVPLALYVAALDDLRQRLDFGSTPAAGADPSAGRLKGLLLAAAFWGLISLVTPCVFPMIPITISLFLKQSQQSPAQVLKLAAVYCLTIVAVIGASAVFLLSVFRQLSVDPYMNIFLGGLFVFFALSLFGMYDITLPGFLLRFTERRRGAGGLIGTVFGALAFSIVSFTCVAPFLGGFAGLAASGNFAQWELVLAGLTFATAFASPFFVLALFPSLLKKLPKSGGWLDAVKVVMGFLELAAAFKFFRTAELRLLDPTQYFTYDVVLAAWVAIATACGLYLLNLFRLPHDEEKPNVGVSRMLFALAFLGLAVYLAPALWKGGPGQRPGGVVFAWVDAFLLPDADAGELSWGTDLPTAASFTPNADRRYVFVDFTGVTCTNCRYNEHHVFPKPQVRNLLQRYTLVQMYTDEVPAWAFATTPDTAARDDEARANLEFQKAAFGDERLPLYAILEPLPSGRVKVIGVYPEGKINDVPAFVEFLKKPFGE